jgi:DNA-binding IclR family transcriptional regulator
MATARGPRSHTGIRSVGRSLDVLEALTAADELRLTEIAEAVHLLPSTTHRVLATLLERGYVAQNPATGRYLLGHKVLEIGSQIARRASLLRSLAQVHLVDVREATGETSALVLLNGDRVVYVAQEAGTQSVRLIADLGVSFPAHTAAGGRAILAFSPADTVDAVLSHPELGVTSQAEGRRLVAELEEIRGRGWAIDDERLEDGVVCVAAPVFGHTGLPMAAISVSGPSGRMQRLGYESVGALLAREAELLSRKIRAASSPVDAG